MPELDGKPMQSVVPKAYCQCVYYTLPVANLRPTDPSHLSAYPDTSPPLRL